MRYEPYLPLSGLSAALPAEAAAAYAGGRSRLRAHAHSGGIPVAAWIVPATEKHPAEARALTASGAVTELTLTCDDPAGRWVGVGVAPGTSVRSVALAPMESEPTPAGEDR